MSVIEEDFDPATAATLRAELEEFSGKCWYDPVKKKIVYKSADAALHAYMTMQTREMERHKWLESEKAAHDLRDESLSDWVKRHSTAFSSYWHRTHAFIPPSEESLPTGFPDKSNR